MAKKKKTKITAEDIISGINKEVERQMLESSLLSPKVKEEIIENKEKIEEIKKKEETISNWETSKILTFKDFVSSPEHMNFPMISERQLAVAEYMFGDDPKKMFDNGRHTCVLVWGKGCLTGSHMVVDAMGNVDYIYYLHLKNKPLFLYSVDPNTGKIIKVLATPPIKKENPEECYHIITQNMVEFTVSEDHKFLTKDGWKTLKELRIWDSILLPINFDLSDEQSDVTEDEGLLYGFLSIVGCLVENHNRIMINNVKIARLINEFAIKEGIKLSIKRARIINVLYINKAKAIQLAKRIKIRIPRYKIMSASRKVRGKVVEGLLEYVTYNTYLRSVYYDYPYISEYEFIRLIAQSVGIILPTRIKNYYPQTRQMLLEKVREKNFDAPAQLEYVEEAIDEKIYIGKADVYTFTVPFTKNYIVGGAVHHNSGKDTISALMQLYIVYVLLNMKIPQNFFGMASQSSIDLLNIASTREQAQEVYFQLLKRMVLNWSWLKNKFEFVVNGRYFSSPASSDLDLNNKVVITNESIIFPKNIQMFSGSSEADSSEGKNLICFVLDEADAFKNVGSRSAEKIYRMCRTSAYSRFKDRAKGFIISYPRSEKGFILSLYNIAKDDIKFYCDRAATWEVVPHKFSKETFKFNGVDVPIDFYDEFKYDPIGSQLSYMSVPIEKSSKFVSYEELGTAFNDIDRVIIEFKDYLVEKQEKTINKDIIYVPPKIPKYTYCISFDLAVKEDNCAVALSHVVEDKVVVDFVTVWSPDKEKDIKVSLENVFFIVEKLAEIVKPAIIAGDFWNSALLCQKLTSKGYNAKTIKVGYDDYLLFRRFIINGTLRLPKDKDLIDELINLYYAKSDKVDHPEGKHDDRVMACLIGFKSLLNINKVEDVNFSVEGEFVGKNVEKSDFSNIEFSEKNKEGFYVDGFFFSFDDDNPIRNVFKKI